jgi:MFS family permease
VPRRRWWGDNPWWIPPFLGGVPDIEPRLVRLLGLVSLALFFEQYDLSMLTAALKFIAEDLGLAEKDFGRYLGLIRLGALPAFFVVPLADRIGRRRMFLVGMIGISVTTFLTAFSYNVLQFVMFQMATRLFMVLCSAVAIVIITEEFPAAYRGWGIGMLGALAAAGNGFGALLFAAIEVLPYGWRALYFVGLVPVMLLPYFRREVRETERFERHRNAGLAGGDTLLALTGWLRPLLAFARTHPARAIGVALAGGLAACGSISVFQFSAYHAQHVHGWSPGQYSAMVICGGAVGIIGNVVAGRLGDRIGRRAVGAMFLGLYPACAALYYHGPSWSLPIAFAAFVFCITAGHVVIRALSTELFPTSQRGTSAGWLALVDTIGAAAGLGLLGLGTQMPGQIARVTSLLAIAALVGGLSLLMLPETRRRELESISGEPLLGNRDS